MRWSCDPDQNMKVTMSVETIAIVISAAALLLTSFGMFLGGLAWIVRRMDAQFERMNERIDDVELRLGRRIDEVEAKLSLRIDDLEAKLSKRIDAVETKLSLRIDQVGAEVVDVKIAVARLEGPPRHLQPIR